jgi:hypothetical protein
MTGTEIASALTSLKAAIDIIKGINALNIDVAVKQKASDLLDSLISIQSSMVTLQIESQELLKVNEELKRQLAQFEHWESTKGQYILSQVGSGLVMMPSSSHPNPEPLHYLCTNCWENRKKSVLQKSEHYGAAPHYCPACKATFYL